METPPLPYLVALAAAGIGGGLWLLARGLGGYRTATRLADTGTSTIASMAAGEVRVAGVIEAAEVTLVSPLQSEPCVYYRASIDSGDDGADFQPDLEEERAIGFRVRDASGSIRVFPRSARWDAPVRFDDATGSLGDEPAALRLRVGDATTIAEPDREQAIAALLSVQAVGVAGGHPLLRAGSSGRRRYRESRLAPGDAVTVVGRALPFADLADPTEADIALGSEVLADDPEVAVDLAEARASGRLADDPDDAWGNAGIPGFGIGRPVRAPELDPAAHPLPLAPAVEAERFKRTFHIAPAALVIASAPGVPLLIVHGVPGAAVERHQDRFLVGLLGALLAIASAVALAVVVTGGSGA